ncbi:MAG: 50S ribosomal protein L24 [Candidatus Moranbacteria bacterium]|nr:50S ribosomal protein L24 [Candidatus Moranbacteria bacterium]
MNVKKGDQVVIISGKDKGFKGEVIEINPKKSVLVVDGANLIKKHIKNPKSKEKGQKIEMPAPIHASNVKLYCDNCKKAVRSGSRITKDSKSKIRICKKCQNEI